MDTAIISVADCVLIVLWNCVLVVQGDKLLLTYVVGKHNCLSDEFRHNINH